MHAAFHEYLASTAVGGLVLAYGIALLVMSHTRGDRAMASAWICTSIITIAVPQLAGQVDPDQITVAERLLPVLVAGVFVGVWAYLLHLIRTSNGTTHARRLMRIAVHAGAWIAVAPTVLAVIDPATFFNDFTLSIHGAELPREADFWLFGGPYLVSAAGYAVAWVTLARQDVDPGERTRAIAHAAAIPPLMFALVLALPAGIIAYVAAVAISLYGIMGHLTVQGERAAFLSRFLSPQVAELVRLRGIAAVMKPQELELSVVCIDFRGFTSYTEAIPTQAVIDLIRDYHEAVGEVVAEHGGMVKDYAGDGILILVGAPIATPDHVEVALALALEARTAANQVSKRWSTGPHPLGVGIGVASGQVTVGAIGDNAQMEYTAVGTAVNLAARLCAAADDGSILIDATIAARADGAARPQGEISIKGLTMPAEVFEYSA